MDLNDPFVIQSYVYVHVWYLSLWNRMVTVLSEIFYALSAAEVRTTMSYSYLLIL
jgi:hypothetical protein